MLKPVKMQKVRIAAVKSITTGLLSKLHTMGMLEIRRMPTEDFRVGRTIKVYDEISAQLVRLRSLRSMLGITKDSPPVEMPLDKALAAAGKISIDEKVRAVHGQLSGLETRLAELTRRLDDARLLAYFKDIDFSSLQSSRVDFHVGTVATQKLPELRKALPQAKFGIRHRKEDSVIICMCSKEHGELAELALSKAGFNPIDTSGFTTPSETIHGLSQEARKVNDEIGKVKETLSSFAEEYGGQLQKLIGALHLWSDRGIASKDMGFGADTVVLEGWVKERDYEGFVSQLAYAFHKKVFVEKIPGGKDVPPTVLDNPKNTTQFQFLVGMFSLPKADEIDPTLILFISIPVIYGMMLGDVFYGLISFFIASWMAGKFKSGLAHEVARIWKFSALAGMVFGVFYDEWFGLPLYALLEVFQNWGLLNLHAMGIDGPLYAGFSRTHQVNLLIGISVILGLVHLAFGYALGAINEWHHNRKHAIGKIFWIVLELGGFLAVSAMMFGLFSPEVGMAGVALAIISIIVIGYTEGMIGIVELPGLLGNALSYARIAAVGLAGVILAELINDAFIPTPEQGIFALVVLPLLIILHLLNIGIAMVECIVQGGRLNLIEFYTKFFHGGGKAFAPFSVKERM